MLYRNWSRVALANLLLVAAAGLLLRYKALFSLPLFEYQYLLYGHSHFAFSGWISLALYVAILSQLRADGPGKTYRQLLWANQLTAVGMLISFPIGGYGVISIVFSTLNIFVAWAFALLALADLRRSPLPRWVKQWLVAALCSHIISAAGPFTLAALMAGHSHNQTLLTGAVYFYLHFEYNGWFVFALLGLFFAQVHQKYPRAQWAWINLSFWLMLLALLPAYLLSALWAPLPRYAYAAAVMAASLQLGGALVMAANGTVRRYLREIPPGFLKRLWQMAAAALVLKYVLQCLSTIPSLGHMAFGVRPIIIGYLHLVMLVLVSFFMIGYFAQQQWLRQHSPSKAGLWLFIIGVLLNEAMLLAQGLAHVAGRGFAMANYGLLLAALFMFSGMCGVAGLFGLGKTLRRRLLPARA